MGTCFRTVLLKAIPKTLSYGNNVIAAGLDSSDIIILDAITGSQAAVLLGIEKLVMSVAFSPDGSHLYLEVMIRLSSSGICRLGYCQDLLWPYWLGFFCLHLLRLHQNCFWILWLHNSFWDIQTGEFKHIIKQEGAVKHTCFSPINPGYLISISKNKVQEWDNQMVTRLELPMMGLTFLSPQITPSLLCTMIKCCSSRLSFWSIVANCMWPVTMAVPSACCFSPDGKIVAVVANGITLCLGYCKVRSPPYWDLCWSCWQGYLYYILLFLPHNSIQWSLNQFWKIGGSLIDPAATDSKSTLPTSASIESISLQPRDGLPPQVTQLE